MPEIKITKVETKRDRRTFLTIPWMIYKDDPLWVSPPIPLQMSAINPESGAFFLRGEADFFIAWKDGKPVGRICAGEDPPANQDRGRKDGFQHSAARCFFDTGLAHHGR